MIIGSMISALAILVPAAYLLGRRVTTERAVDQIVEQSLDPGIDVTEFVAALRKAQDENA